MRDIVSAMNCEEKSFATKYKRLAQREESHSEDESFENHGSKADKKPEWTTRRKLLLIGVCLVNLVAFGAIALIMPFFPTVGEEMGLSKTEIGFIFSVCPLVGVFMGPLTGRMIAIVNRKLIISGGLLLAAAAQVLFGFGKLLPPGAIFMVWCLLTRILTAIGSVSSYTAILTTLPQEFNTNYATVLAIGEICCGLGLAGAPAIAGVVYQVGGYMWPTFAFGLLMSAVALFLIALFWNTQFEGFEKDTKFLHSVTELLKSPKVLIGVESVLIASLSFSVLEPIYALFGHKILHLNASHIGLLYTPLWISYLIASGMAGILVDHVGKHLLLMIFGFSTGGLGFILIGPAPSLERVLPVGTIWLTAVAEVCIGVGSGFAFVPSLPYMMQSAGDAGLKLDSTASSLLSAMFASATSLGVFAGPTLAGAIADVVAVRMDFAIIGLIIAVQGGLLVLYVSFSWCVSLVRDVKAIQTTEKRGY